MPQPGQTVERSLVEHRLAVGLPSDGGASARWVRVKVGPLPIVFPNSDSRRRALHRHDIHHLLTGYATDLRGEAEISAWELAAGCHRYAAAWGFGLIGLVIGLGIAPRRTLRAFRRGRTMRTLYDPAVDLAAVCAMTVDVALAHLHRA